MSLAGAPSYTQGSGTDSLASAKPILLASAPSSSYGALLPIGARVIVQSTNSVYVLTSKSTSGGITSVTWTIAGSPTGDVSTLTGDSGTATPAAGNIKISGTASEITTAGSGSTITLSLPSALTVPGSLTVTSTLGLNASGAAAIAGTATLVAGTVTVDTSSVTANSKIFVSRNTTGGTLGNLSAPVGSITAGTSFVINSSSSTETSTVNWFFFN